MNHDPARCYRGALMTYERNEIINTLRQGISVGTPVLCCGAGLGEISKYLEEGGADMLCVYGVTCHRMLGYTGYAGWLPELDLNQMVIDYGKITLDVTKKIPVIAGIVTGDEKRNMREYLRELKSLGYSGIMPFPPVLFNQGRVLKKLERSGLGIDREIEVMHMAQELGMITIASSFDKENAVMFAKEGIDVLVIHVGITKQERSKSLDQVCDIVNDIFKAVREVNKKMIILVHGGPVHYPENSQYVYDHSMAQGFLAGSSTDRFAIEPPMREYIRNIKEGV